MPALRIFVERDRWKYLQIAHFCGLSLNKEIDPDNPYLIHMLCPKEFPMMPWYFRQTLSENIKEFKSVGFNTNKYYVMFNKFKEFLISSIDGRNELFVGELGWEPDFSKPELLDKRIENILLLK